MAPSAIALLLLAVTLEDAEDEAERVQVQIDADALAEDITMSWAANMLELRLGEDGVDDEVLPTITIGATEAELANAPDAQGLRILGRKQLAGHLRVDVLESQVRNKAECGCLFCALTFGVRHRLPTAGRHLRHGEQRGPCATESCRH